MDLSVVIVSWNTTVLLAQCLDSIYAHPPASEFEIWVVDNASADGSAAMVRARFPQVRLIENRENVGFARANNQAIQASDSRYVLLLNSDTAVPAGAITAMMRFIETHPQAGAMAPKLCNPEGSFQASFARFPTLWSELLLITGVARWTTGPYAPSPRPQTREGAHPVDWVAGAALVVRRAAIEQVGLLDESYFLYGEEMDWCWRLERGGWEVWYLPTVAVIHHGGASTHQRAAASYKQLYANKVRFFAKAYGPAAAHHLRLAFNMVAVVRLILWTLLSILRLPVDGGQSMRERARLERALLGGT